MNQHLSVRVPWHDHGWDGTVCCRPEKNQACRALRNIAEGKDDNVEKGLCGQIALSRDEYTPPCLKESGTFMSEKTVTGRVKHPYTYDKRFKHISETEFDIGSYSFTGRPYRWTLRESDDGTSPHDLYFTKYDKEIEPDVGSKTWVSHGDNQKNIFNYFYKDVKPDNSLVVAYAKAVPFIENPGRIIIGIGLVSKLGELESYKYYRTLKDDDIPAFLWERKIEHTIRKNRENGFLFPFSEIQQYIKEHPEQNPDELVVIAPDEYSSEFSYATEHLSHDALIQILNSTISVLKKYKAINLDVGEGADWDDCITWCKKKKDDIWQDRGVYPGLGAVLFATGIPYGFDVAHVIKSKIKDSDLWEKLPESLQNLKSYLPTELSGIKVTKTQLLTWEKEIYDEKRNLLELLSRFTLSLDQAKLLLNPDDIKLFYATHLTDIHKADLSKAIIKNPYILYEKTRMLEQSYRFGIGQIDLGMFPDKIIREICPVSELSRVEDADDQRRLRAIITSILENESNKGNTLALAEYLTQQVNEFRSDIESIDTKILKETILALEDFFKPIFMRQNIFVLENDKSEQDGVAFKLNRLIEVDDTIKLFVNNRLKTKIELNDEWGNLLDHVLAGEIRSNKTHELNARKEKVNAIEKMAHSGISVLVGGAGTGKTTALVALCLNTKIQNGGILVLAPTGKARVVLSQKLNKENIQHTPLTVFQYLKTTQHCNTKTWSYYLSGKKDSAVPQTVIIDESSMLTEEMFGALAESLESAQRVIFVGDPNQLPPIGAGKPFFELVKLLQNMSGQDHFADLQYSNRQKDISGKDERLDVELIKYFTEEQQKYVGDDIFDRIAHDKTSVEFIHFDKPEEINSLLLDTIVDVTNMKNKDDIDEFDRSLGGEENGEWMNFKTSDHIEDWQIVSPYRNDEASGSSAINRFIHEIYRSNKNRFGQHKKRTTKHPLGNDVIIFGDKVINIRNQDRSRGMKGYPADNCQQYIANGEVGIVNRIWQKESGDKFNTHQIEFSSQQGFAYNYYSSITEGDPDLELAYALTVHKSQGSGFKATIFIINEPESGINYFLSRELIYTALTRQSQKVYILYNKEPWQIKKYSDPIYSDLTRRLTNLFTDKIVIRGYKSGWYDNRLIHLTTAGEKVRSKSEVIIANELNHAGINYVYEQELTLPDGSKWLPDFTITTKEG
ncbi:MAG: ATP-dependent RecD-like DNA helicase, partial [Spirochaetaceae bacterium]|nr:ATP-dependent RecD-like DNA helicase [Spirochaetaceae bacterium]